MSFYIEKGEKEAFRQTVTKAFRFVLIAASGLMVYFMIFSEESILILSGKDFLAAVVPMQLLMTTLLLIGLSNTTGMQILTPMGQENKVLKSIIAGAIVDFVLNLFLIPRYASSGAAFATVMAELIVVIVQFIYLKDILRGLFKDINLGKILISLGCATAAALIFRSLTSFPALLTMIIAVVIFFGIYGGLLLLMKEPMAYEILNIGLNIIRKKK